MNEGEKEQPVQPSRKPTPDVERVGVLRRLSDGKEYSLGFGSLRVGRQKRADLVIIEKTVSRHHADICYESGRYVLYDHSTNGTWVNGQLVAVARPLRDRDKVKFGRAEFLFTLKEVPKQAALRAAVQTAPRRIPKSITQIMKGGKGRGKRRGGKMRGLILLLLLVVLVLVVVYSFFPDLADRLIGQLPPALQELVGGG